MSQSIYMVPMRLVNTLRPVILIWASSWTPEKINCDQFSAKRDRFLLRPIPDSSKRNSFGCIKYCRRRPLEPGVTKGICIFIGNRRKLTLFIAKCTAKNCRFQLLQEHNAVRFYSKCFGGKSIMVDRDLI